MSVLPKADEGESRTLFAGKPRWLKVPAPLSPKCLEIGRILRELRLNTVCQSASCPNVGQCWGHGEAAFMILGATCTRHCGFCDVTTGRPEAVDVEEPARLTAAVQRMALAHVVITSVNRDDLEDGGAGQFAQCVELLHRLDHPPSVEVLTPDFQGRTLSLDRVLDARPEVFNLNTETVPRLYPLVRPASSYPRVLQLLAQAAARGGVAVKSGIMLGLGEEIHEVLETLVDLKKSGVTLLTVGQYLRPGVKNLPVQRYVGLEEFDDLKRQALEMGFHRVASHPLARSSFHAKDLYHVGPS